MRTLSYKLNVFDFSNQKQKVIKKINKKDSPIIEVTWATSDKDVKEAQKLRYKIFSQELGANLESESKKFDYDIFDDHCEHLIVRNKIN